MPTPLPLKVLCARLFSATSTLFDLLPQDLINQLTSLLEFTYDGTPFKALQLLKYTLECRYGKVVVIHSRSNQCSFS